jgi:hypothetical protein
MKDTTLDDRRDFGQKIDYNKLLDSRDSSDSSKSL